MMGLIDERTLLIISSAALVLACFIGLIAMAIRGREQARREKLVSISEISRDWQPTWRINAVSDAWVMEHEKDDIPSNFVLRIEENRTVRDIGGGEMLEIRWRAPTRAEVRDIVRRYHKIQDQTTVPDVIEFERQSHRRAHNGFYADRAGEPHSRRVDGTTATLVPAPGQNAQERRQPSAASANSDREDR